MTNLTPNRVRILQSALADRLGVVTRPYLPGFEGVTWDRNAKALCDGGFLKPYVHGGFEITEAGRSAATNGGSSR